MPNITPYYHNIKIDTLNFSWKYQYEISEPHTAGSYSTFSCRSLKSLQLNDGFSAGVLPRTGPEAGTGGEQASTLTVRPLYYPVSQGQLKNGCRKVYMFYF